MRYQTKFLLSAMAEAQFPATDVPEIAFLGRSNVGKSSLLNALLKASAAKTSSTPGRTRAINFFALQTGAQTQPKMLFADLPGYGYAKISKSISAQWGEFIDAYLTGRKQLALCICLIDLNIPPQSSDRQLLEFLHAQGHPFLILGTKADRLSNNQRVRQLQLLTTGLGVDRIVPCSASTGYGLGEVWGAIDSAAEEWSDKTD